MSVSENEKQVWAEKHARRIGLRFMQWQQPLGIDSDEYLKYLTQELIACHDDQLQKALIESIS